MKIENLTQEELEILDMILLENLIFINEKLKEEKKEQETYLKEAETAVNEIKKNLNQLANIKATNIKVLEGKKTVLEKLCAKE